MEKTVINEEKSRDIPKLVMEEYQSIIGSTVKDTIIVKRFEMPEEDDNGLLSPESGLITDSDGVDREDTYKPRFQNKGIVIAHGPECKDVVVGDIIHWSLDNYPRSTVYFDKTDASAWSSNVKTFSPYCLTYESYGVDFIEPAE